MENTIFSIFSIFSAALLLVLTITHSKASDQDALAHFKSSITSDPHHLLATNWSTTHPSATVCHWIGVSCGGTRHSNRVTGLNVSRFSLGGTLSPHLGNLTFLAYLDLSYNHFVGLIPRELARLRRLRSIDVGVNSLAGEIPQWFGSLPRLETMRLNNNTFSGSIPEEIGNCSSLQILDVSYNTLTGSIPYGIFNLSAIAEIWIRSNRVSGRLPSDMCSNLPNLNVLALPDNQLEGHIPPSTGNCRELQVLELSQNSFSGSIPEDIGNCSSLQMLYVSNNQLTGSIPNSIFNLESITLIHISSNELSGSLPNDMCGDFSNLVTVSMSRNRLEGPIPRDIHKCRELEILSLSFNGFNGEIPSEIGRLSMLRVLYLGPNGFTGGIPREIGNLSRLQMLDIGSTFLTGNLPGELHNLASLQSLAVPDNQLSGSIPPWIFNMSSLNVLDLSSNRFSGMLPLSPDLSNLEGLYLGLNELNGEIPISIANASNLRVLSLESNLLSGTIPNFGSLRLLRTLSIALNSLTGFGFISSLANCQFLDDLLISANPLYGVLPDSIGNLSKSLTRLGATGCGIHGVIPSTIGNLIGLQFIILSENQITGVIPPRIGELSELQVLRLHGNRLHGFIPQHICALSNLGDLFLHDNNLTGPIPECFSNLQSLRMIYLCSNRLNSTIPLSFWSLKDLTFLNLSSNLLTGQVPYEIATLRQLTALDLSDNRFSGDIPRSIDACQSLTLLNLSNNRFERSIPSSLGDIRALGVLDLSHNNLSGEIPESLERLVVLQYLNVSYNMLEGSIPTGGPFLNFTSQSFLHNIALCGEQRLQVPPCRGDNLEKPKKAHHLIKYIVPPFISVIVFTAIVVLILVRIRKPKRSPASNDGSIVTWRRISYTELARGTNDFNETNLLGNGGFGSVFKGVLSDGLNVAVKVFKSHVERAIRSFDTECEILGSVRHRNLVQIIGCCTNAEFKALVLVFMPNGSLEKWLHSEHCCLDLMQRLQIAIDVASALEYLHHGHTFSVVHCDIKPSNVLLDETMVAHLGDFGIAKLFNEGETTVHTKTLPTIGYAAPEYGSEGKVSTSIDVYSYGILLIEVFTCKKPTDGIFNEEMSLKEWILEALRDNTIAEIVCPDLLSTEDQHFCAKEECVSSIFGVAMRCLAAVPDERVNMIETVATLQRIKAKVEGVTTSRQQCASSLVSRQ